MLGLAVDFHDLGGGKHPIAPASAAMPARDTLALPYRGGGGGGGGKNHASGMHPIKMRGQARWLG